MQEVSSFIGQRRRVLTVFAAAVMVALMLPASGGASFLGHNGRIAFEKSTEPEGKYESAVWAMNGDGTGATRLTTGHEARAGTYSADGTRLAFGRYDEVWVAAADGSGARALSIGVPKETNATRWVANYKAPETGIVYPWVKIEEKRETRDALSEPTFSPDGKALAVVHYIGTFALDYICSVNANNDPNCNGSYYDSDSFCEDCGSGIDAIDAGTGATLATLVPRTVGVYLNSPTYSGGGALAFIRETEGVFDVRQVVSVPAPGAAPVVLASGEVNDPDFSPDGSRVVYSADRRTIGIVPAAGGVPATIPIPPPLPTNKAWLVRSPIWSPDGSSIVFANLGLAPGAESYRQGGIYLMRPDGSGMTAIQGDATIPSGWQPVPLTPASASKGKKKVRLSKKGVAVVGKVACGSTPCALKATLRKLKVGKKLFGVKAILPPSLAPGASAPLKVKVTGKKALAALRAKRGGRLKLSVAVTDAAGAQTLGFGPKLLPPKKHKKKK